MGTAESKMAKTVRKEMRKNYKYLRDEISQMTFWQRVKFAWMLVFKIK